MSGWALVTGASSGIGYAIADALARQGMHLCLIARDGERLASSQEKLQSLYSPLEIDTRAIDLAASAETVRALLATIEIQPTVVVHSAGAFSSASILETEPQRLQTMFQVNAASLLTLAQHFAAALERNSGQLVVVNSSVALQDTKAVPGGYAATKVAAKAVTDALRDSFNPRGVRVLSVYPGRTATPMQEALFKAESRDYPADKLLQSEDVASAVTSALNLPRTAEVTDVAIRPMQKT